MVERKKNTNFVAYSQLGSMVKKVILNDLLSNQDITSLEKHLVYQYLNSKKLDFTKSPILTEYLKGFEKNAKLFFDVSFLEIETLKDLENHLEFIIPRPF